jgi:type II secretory pathway component GspD/PulD (secretin)
MKTHLSILLLACLLAGCQSTNIPNPIRPVPASTELTKARDLYEQGKLTEALIACVDIAHRHPHTPGLSELRSEIMTTLNDRRTANQRLRRNDSMTRGMLEPSEDAMLPDTYGLRRRIQGNDTTHIRENAPLMKLLDEEIELHFDAVSLADIITYLGQERQINIIADPTLETPAVTIHAQRITLNELFEYLSRNMEITFHMGKGVIWVTQAEEQMPSTPLFTRVYRLRYGLSPGYLTEDGVDAEMLILMDAIDRFVPIPDGSDLMYDSHSHILLVKNTERNLRMVDQLVEAMDISPPQVLIEARFISTNISDLRELGIDWLLQSNVVTSETGGSTRTRIDEGATINFGEAVNAGEGLSASFTGILTDPQFQAVLHALEIETDARTLSAPKVIAVNNRPSFIRIGRDISYVADVQIERESFGTGTERDELLIRDPVVEILETGFELQATPSVGLNRRDISLRLRPEITELIRFREVSQTVLDSQNGNNGNENDNGAQDAQVELPFAGIEFPEVARSLIETEVVVQSGETVVMGGLMRHRDQEDVRGVPLLSSLPIIGNLFTRSSIRQEKENLLVFVTATLISRRGEDLLPMEWDQDVEGETRGRIFQSNGQMDETFSD